MKSNQNGTTREIVTEYLSHGHSEGQLVDDVVFTIMARGEQHRRRESVKQMLHYFYWAAFDATAETHSLTIDGDQAVWEGVFIGKDIGDFGGVAPTTKEMHVPIAVIYDVHSEGSVYPEVPAFLQQVGVA